MIARQMLRSAVTALFAAGYTAAQAGGDVAPGSGVPLREAALAAARQRSVVEAAFRETVTDAVRITQSNNANIMSASAASDPLSYTLKVRSTEVTLDICSGAHILMTSNLDSITELIVHP